MTTATKAPVRKGLLAFRVFLAVAAISGLAGVNALIIDSDRAAAAAEEAECTRVVSDPMTGRDLEVPVDCPDPLGDLRDRLTVVESAALVTDPGAARWIEWAGRSGRFDLEPVADAVLRNMIFDEVEDGRWQVELPPMPLSLSVDVWGSTAVDLAARIDVECGSGTVTEVGYGEFEFSAASTCVLTVEARDPSALGAQLRTAGGPGIFTTGWLAEESA